MREKRGPALRSFIPGEEEKGVEGERGREPAILLLSPGEGGG